MSNLLLAAPIPPDGRLQVWRNIFSGTWEFQTRWKATSDPSSPWTNPWGPFNPPPPSGVNLPFVDMTAGVLSDGRTQFWGVDTSGVVYTSWKVSTAHDSLWTGLSVFNTAPIPNVLGIAVAALPDKRLQLFFMDGSLQTWTSWKTTTDPKSPWTTPATF
jgi:hypothetical protein